MEGTLSFPSKTLIVVLVLLHICAPLLQARALGGLDELVAVPLMLPGDGAATPKFNMPAVSRPGGYVPLPPQPDGPYQPGSAAGVSGGRGQQSPPSPMGNTPPHYRRPGFPNWPAAGVSEVLRDAIRYVMGA